MAGRGDVGRVADIGGDLGGQGVLLRHDGDRVGGSGGGTGSTGCTGCTGCTLTALDGGRIGVLPFGGTVVTLPLGGRLRPWRSPAALPLVGVVPGALLLVAAVDLVGAPAGNVAPPGRLAWQWWPLLTRRPIGRGPALVVGASPGRSGPWWA
jgi:hypothetical protein